MFRIKIDKADQVFSKFIRTRDNWTCNRCHHKHEEGSQGLHCSHFFGRGKESTRFDPNNCDALCFACHRLWGHGDEREIYKAFKIKQLGQKGFDLLELKSNTPCKKDREWELLIATQLLKNLEKNKKK